jgi:Trypsin-like peptidase domain
VIKIEKSAILFSALRQFGLIFACLFSAGVASSADKTSSETVDAPNLTSAGSAASFAVHPEDFNKTVLPITELKLLGLAVEGDFGTGFCLDSACRFIGTNYHVAVMGQPRKIKGERVLQRYVATGPADEGATLNEGPSLSPLKYTLSRDLAIFELRYPLRQYHGADFSLDELQSGQEVDIYAYPKETINPIRVLRQFHGTFKGQTATGLLAFDYSLSTHKAIRPGASGGLVVDSKTKKVVGILNGIARNGEPIALAVPVQSLADFLWEVQPYLAQTIFPKSISPISTDLYPKFVPTHSSTLEQRPEESAAVKALRSKAQLLTDKLHNFIAVQTFAWGSEDSVPAAESAYEIQVLSGHQQFRAYPDGTKQLKDVPFPPLNTVMVPGGEWSELPETVGTELHLNIHQADDVVLDGQRIKVFQYWAQPEDSVCRWKSVQDFGFFAVGKIATVACYGEVWTDQDMNILRMSEHYELPGKWKDYQAVVTYGWLRREGEIPLLMPLTIATQAEYNKKTYWCRGQFTGYREFKSQAKMVVK